MMKLSINTNCKRLFTAVTHCFLSLCLSASTRLKYVYYKYNAGFCGWSCLFSKYVITVETANENHKNVVG